MRILSLAKAESCGPDDDDVEEMLEILMKIAQSEGREFLAYLLGMALMEARNQAPRGPIFRISRRNPGFAALSRPGRMARRIAGDALSKGLEHPAMSRLHE